MELIDYIKGFSQTLIILILLFIIASFYSWLFHNNELIPILRFLVITMFMNMALSKSEIFMIKRIK